MCKLYKQLDPSELVTVTISRDTLGYDPVPDRKKVMTAEEVCNFFNGDLALDTPFEYVSEVTSKEGFPCTQIADEHTLKVIYLEKYCR